MSADGQLLGENRLVIRVRYREFHSLYGGKNLLVVLLLANHGFDVNGVSGPVDGPVRIDIGQQVGRPILPEPITPRSDNRHVLPMPRQYQNVVNSLPSVEVGGQRSHAFTVGAAARLLFAVGPQSHLGLGHRSAGCAVAGV